MLVSDFADPAAPNVGRVLESARGRGAGVDVIEFAPGSSTRAHVVPAETGTNLLTMLSSPRGARDWTLSGYTIRATDQGHAYNVLRLAKVEGATLSDLSFEGGFGTSSRPPGETRVLTVWRSTDVRTERLRIDGRGTAACGVGHPGPTARVTHVDLEVTGCRFAPLTTYGVDTLTTHNLRVHGNGRGINHERVTGPVRHTALYVALPREPADSAGQVHMTLHNDQADNPDVEVQLAGWEYGPWGPHSPFTVKIGRFYNPLGVHPRGTPALQTSVPRFYGPDGAPLNVADAGAPAKHGLPAIAPRDVDRARADPAHWVLVLH